MIPGTEFADPPPPRLGEPGSPTKRVPGALSPLAVAPIQFPSYGGSEYELEGLGRGMAGLGIGEREGKGKGGKENVLVCVRVRPPAAKLASAAGAASEEAWDVSERTGMVGLKTGGTEFSFGESLRRGSEEGADEEYRFGGDGVG